MEGKCGICEEGFEKYQWNQKNCYDCLEKHDRRFKGRPKKNCPICKVEFQPRIQRQTYCGSECGEKGRQDKYYERTYGISRDQFNQLVEDAGGRCNICGSEGFIMKQKGHKAKLIVDHCHDGDHVRGVLCHNCNRGIGLLQEDPAILASALEYLGNDLKDNVAKGKMLSEDTGVGGLKDLDT